MLNGMFLRQTQSRSCINTGKEKDKNKNRAKRETWRERYGNTNPHLPRVSKIGSNDFIMGLHHRHHFMYYLFSRKLHVKFMVMQLHFVMRLNLFFVAFSFCFWNSLSVVSSTQTVHNLITFDLVRIYCNFQFVTLR